MSKKYKRILLLNLLLLCLLSSFRLFDNITYWFMDIFSHFAVQYSFLALIMFLICLWKRFIPMAVLAILLFILNASILVDLGRSVHAAGQAETTFKIYSANIHKLNNDLSKLNHELHVVDPEIILLLEVTPEHVEQIRSVIQTYPYRIENTSIGDSGIGVVFLSKFPVRNYHVSKLAERGNLLLEATLEINQKSVIFYGVHAQRPGLRNFNERKSQFFLLARKINEHSLPVIVAGDLNSTPYSPIFRQLLKLSGLRDSREGFGWQPSWPTNFPPLWLPIDHILVSPEIQVYRRTTGSYFGSDHYPVFAELSI